MAIRALNGNAPADAKLLLNKMNSTAQKVRLGDYIANQRGVVKGIYSFAVQGGAVTSVNLKDENGRDIVLPSGAIITQVFIDEVSNVTGGAGSTIAIGANTTTDLIGATAIASFTGIIAGIPTGTAANMVKLTADRTLTATIGTDPVTAGVLHVYVEFVYVP